MHKPFSFVLIFRVRRQAREHVAETLLRSHATKYRRNFIGVVSGFLKAPANNFERHVLESGDKVLQTPEGRIAMS